LNSAPLVKTPPSNITVSQGSADQTIDMAGIFDDPDITNSQVRFFTSRGNIDVELFDREAPRTVANFFNYVQSARYINSIFHRLVPNFVLQGGGFSFTENPSNLVAINTDPAVENEFSTTRSNVAGTIAMAKLGNDPNSATSQFFFNLEDNSSNLDNQNGGFTVFGRILGDSSMQVLQALTATPVTDQSNGDPSSPFSSIPLNDYTGANFPTDTTASNYLLLQDTAIVSRTEELTYTATTNSPGLVIPTVVNNRLNLQFVSGATGTAVITITATDRFGESVSTSLNVTVQ
jgi:cyclophilin family peptidyl-prolyl cis-trans isomerase